MLLIINLLIGFSINHKDIGRVRVISLVQRVFDFITLRILRLYHVSYKLCLNFRSRVNKIFVSLKNVILTILFGEFYIFKEEEYTISFRNLPLLTFSNFKS